MKFIHLTDLHLVKPGDLLWGTDPAARAGQCLDDIARWHSDAAFLIISGDLTDGGDPSAYQWLVERISNYPLQVFVTTGNHDDRTAFGAAFPELPRDQHGFFQYTHQTDFGTFLFLDTLNDTSSAGQLCDKRLDWLRQQLEISGDQPVWVIMHHPPFDIGISFLDKIKLEEADAFREVVAGHGNIRHIFFGHVHRAAFIQWHGIPFTCLPAVNHQVPLNNGSVASRFSNEPAMYGVVHVTDDQTTVHFDACLDRHAADMG